MRDADKIDGLINNAGVIRPMQLISQISLDEWRSVFAVNLEAPLFLMQLLQDKLHAARVLNVSSGAAYFPVVGWSAYCSSKAALSMLTKCMQVEYKDLAATSVKPGIIDTKMVAEICEAQNMTDNKRDFFKVLKKENRLLTVETVACFLSWLLLDTDKDTYISQEWDIYDKSHHALWLKEPYFVPEI